MTARIYATGNIGGRPELGTTRNGKTYLNVSIGCTKNTKNQQTGQWEPIGAPLWYKATFWEEEAENLANVLEKGMKVTITGEVVVREYTTQNGHTGMSHEIHYPTLSIHPALTRTKTHHTGTNSPQPMPGYSRAGYGSQNGTQERIGFDNNPPF
ncbi:single-stranded DNA-binding protein [Actinotignum urinale]|uniref:single-stranded DNA-binding protein n=1 Tax=Actinotignum urinale TaxID=190146 RepID=UPI002A8140BF|nr:single-stranded DNA-binding protein [Actinotignum urinale]MDY5151356.1 single-stranded DNA-binding protein [Actinotignum urinale]